MIVGWRRVIFVPRCITFHVYRWLKQPFHCSIAMPRRGEALKAPQSSSSSSRGSQKRRGRRGRLAWERWPRRGETDNNTTQLCANTFAGSCFTWCAEQRFARTRRWFRFSGITSGSERYGAIDSLLKQSSTTSGREWMHMLRKRQKTNRTQKAVSKKLNVGCCSRKKYQRLGKEWLSISFCAADTLWSMAVYLCVFWRQKALGQSGNRGDSLKSRTACVRRCSWLNELKTKTKAAAIT